MTKVNWRDMETEELGSVYESLLELTPQLDMGARDFTFAEGDVTRGNARKVSGSYYTPDSLVKLLLDNSLTTSNVRCLLTKQGRRLPTKGRLPTDNSKIRSRWHRKSMILHASLLCWGAHCRIGSML